MCIGVCVCVCVCVCVWCMWFACEVGGSNSTTQLHVQWLCNVSSVMYLLTQQQIALASLARPISYIILFPVCHNCMTIVL